MARDNKDPVIWDVIIVGAGPAGSSAAMVLARVRRKVLLIDDGHPRNARSQGMHNYLTRDGVLPGDFLKSAHGELQKYSVEHHCGKAVSAKRLEQHGFEVVDDAGMVHLGRRLLLATGVKDNLPDIPGMRELWGRGVYHCAYCDGWELCDKKIGLYSSKFNGYGMALALRQLSKEVILFTDGAHYLRSNQRADLDANGIRVVTSRIAQLTCSDDKLTCVSLRNGKDVGCDAVFVNHGHKTNNELLLQLGGRCTSGGAAVTNRRQQCSVPGVFVAGDAALDVQFVIVAAGEGAKAAVAIHDDLLRTDNLLPPKGLVKSRRKNPTSPLG